MSIEPTQADIDAAAAYWGNDNPPLELRAAFARHRIAHSAPAGEVEPVLRWEDDPAGVPNMLALYLGEHKFGAAWETKHTWRTARADEWCSSEQEAKEAEEQAVRDWLARAGLYTHPAPPADLVERIEQLDLLQETNLPNGEWDMETFRVTLALCKRHLSAALAKHGGA